MIKNLLDFINDIKHSNKSEDWLILNVIAFCIGMLVILCGIFIIAAPFTAGFGLLIAAAAWLIGRFVMFLVSKLS